ncbi:MAG TPA: sulfite exporter TauE/SafE family protein [Terriglobales bacterium]|nr:sulfite exporter TauE/SafE family protein [Terriglobales bacterium]
MGLPLGLAPVAFAVAAAAVVKGAIGFGFPTIATPLVALVVDVKTAVVILIVPNMVMDAVQAVRQGEIPATVRRYAVLLLFGALGTYVGTRLLVVLSVRTATLVLGTVVLSAVALNATRWSPRVPPGWTRWLDPILGTGAGILGGLTNVPGTPLVIYFLALGLAKQEFVRAVAVTFMLFKLLQLGTVVWFGLLTPRLLGLSLLLTVIALGGFYAGLAIQERLDQKTFNAVTLVFLGVLGAWLVLRGLG